MRRGVVAGYTRPVGREAAPNLVNLGTPSAIDRQLPSISVYMDIADQVVKSLHDPYLAKA